MLFFHSLYDVQLSTIHNRYDESRVGKWNSLNKFFIKRMYTIDYHSLNFSEVLGIVLNGETCDGCARGDDHSNYLWRSEALFNMN